MTCGYAASFLLALLAGMAINIFSLCMCFMLYLFTFSVYYISVLHFYPCMIISCVFYCQSVTMPKKGPSSAKWMVKLQDFVSGKYKFGKGKKPGKDSKYVGERAQ